MKSADNRRSPWPAAQQGGQTACKRGFHPGSGLDRVSELAREDLAPLARRAREVRIGCGETFIRRGEPGDSLYVIVDGEVEIAAPGLKIGRRQGGGVIGEMAVIWRRPRSADCVALTDVTALRIDHDDFWAMLAERPALAQGIMKVLAARLRATDAA